MKIETKMNAPHSRQGVGAGDDVRAATAEMMAAFEALKTANDMRIEEIFDDGEHHER